MAETDSVPSKLKRYVVVVAGRYAIRRLGIDVKQWQKVRKDEIVSLTEADAQLNAGAIKPVA